MDNSVALQLLQRQVDEIEALVATFPEPGAVTFTPTEEAVLTTSRKQLLEAALATYQSQLSGSVSLLDMKLEGSPIGMHFTLPHDYPDCAPRLQVSCAAGRHVHGQLTHAVHQAVDQFQGNECLLLAVEALQEAASTAVEEAKQHAVEKSKSSEEKLLSKAAPSQIGRRAIWFHHIKSLTKRKHIVEWGKELKLGGFSKPGYPGVIICEGSEVDAEEFVYRLRQLRWKAMAVRGEEREDLKGDRNIDSARKFSGSQIVELDEGSVSELASACKAADLEELFLCAMKISKCA